MSWQQYVDDSLLGTGHIDKAAIFSKAGDSVWAASAGYSISPDEIKEVVKGYNDASSIQSKGLHLAGEKFLVVKADDRSIYGKKGKEGVACVITKLSIIVAHYPESVQAGVAASTVERLADYLIGVGY